MSAAPKPAAWKRALLMLVSTAFSLAIAEAAVRAMGVTDPVLRDADPVLGWAPIPDADGWWTREGHGHVHITEHGFRGVDEAPGRAPEGTLRVALIGDSYVEARQIALESTIGARLEPDLARCLGRPVDVQAFGVSGFGTTQEYLLYRERVAAYHPDLVLLALLTGNDVADEVASIRMDDDPSPYFTRDARGGLVLDTSFRTSEVFRSRTSDSGMLWLRRHSQLVRALRAIGGHGNGAARGELGLSDEAYGPPRTDAWREAWAITEAVLVRFAADVRADGSQFGVVVLSNAIQVDPDAAVRERYRESIGADDLFYPDRRIEAAGARDDYAVLALAPRLRAYAESHGVQLHGFPNTAMGTGHWNEEGHRVASEESARWVCARPELVRP
jgi:hypothetical protein